MSVVLSVGNQGFRSGREGRQAMGAPMHEWRSDGPPDAGQLPPAVAELARAMAEGLALAGRRPVTRAGDTAANDRPPLVDLKEAARLLGVSRMTMTRLCDQGRVPCVIVAQGPRQKLRRVPRAFIDSVASGAMSAGGELDLAGIAAAWLAEHAAPTGTVAVTGEDSLAAAGGAA
jgi:hypothetical protein